MQAATLAVTPLHKAAADTRAFRDNAAGDALYLILAPFCLCGVAREAIPMTDMFISALPVPALQVAGPGLCMIFPTIMAWRPRTVYG